MSKIARFWDERSKLFKSGIIWTIALQPVRLGVQLVIQNVGFPSISSANYAHIGYNVLLGAQLIAALAAFIGLFTGAFEGRSKEPKAVKFAEGVYMVKK